MILFEEHLLDKSEWLKWLNDCPYATFYHTPYWYDAWQLIKGYQVSARLFQTANQTFFFACAVKKSGLGLLTNCLSAPAGTYGAFLCQETISEKAAVNLMNFAGQYDVATLVYCPFQPMHFTPSGEADFTQVIQMDQNFDNLLRKWSKGHLSAAKKGIREGVSVRYAKDISDWHNYYSIYEKKLAVWGSRASSRYPPSFFEYFATLPPSVCRLWIAEHNGSMISGAVVFYFNRHISYWHGASLKIASSLNSAHVLQYYILEDAANRPFDWYDLNPSGGHTGVVHFKNGFGSQQLPVITGKYSGIRNIFIRQMLIKSGYVQSLL